MPPVSENPVDPSPVVGKTNAPVRSAPSGAALWLAGARPRTLPAAVVPVAVGTAVGGTNATIWWRAGAALVVSLALQVGVNFANDYSDGVKGTDEDRVGPLRLVGSGLARPQSVKRAAFASFGVAAAAGLALAAATTWWLIAVGIAAIAAAWFYTGGPRPYGYAGLGEAFVFVFFGLVATLGSHYVQHPHLTWTSVMLGSAVGLLAVSLLVINNLRDIPGDTVSGKRTMAVRLGDHSTRWLYGGCIAGAFVCVFIVGLATRSWWMSLVLLSAPLASAPISAVRAGASGRNLIPVLGATGKLQLWFGAALTVAVVLAR